jgi:hypothetical protein
MSPGHGRRRRKPLAKVAELLAPAPDVLLADNNTPFKQTQLDIPRLRLNACRLHELPIGLGGLEELGGFLYPRHWDRKL